jgi:hypothetical protein
LKSKRETQSAAGTPSARPISGRQHADLEGQREAVDELALVEDRREPAQAVALGREGRDLLPEEGEPGDEDQRRQDIGSAIAAAPFSAQRRAAR